jgi:spore maturation protein CgeB
MDLLYVGPMNLDGTCYSRYIAFLDLNIKTSFFDTNKYIDFNSMSRFERMIELITLNGQRIKELKSAFFKVVEEEMPKIIWFDKAIWLTSRDIKRLKKLNVKLVHHNTDFLYAKKISMWISRRRLRETATFFDFFITTNKEDYKKIKRISEGKIILSRLGYDDRRLSNIKIDSNIKNFWKSDVVFVGHYEPRTENYLLELAKSNIGLKVYGANWKNSRLSKKYPNLVGGYLTNLEYYYAIKGAKIGLSIYSQYNKNQDSGRSYEIPAIGTMMIALRSKTHTESFEEDVEAVFFDNPSDLVNKCKYYISMEKQRNIIANRGNNRCIRSGYSWAEIMKRDFQEIVKLL